MPGSRSTRMARGTYLLPVGTEQDSDLQAESSEEGPWYQLPSLQKLLVALTEDTGQDSHKILKGALPPPQKKTPGKDRNPKPARPSSPGAALLGSVPWGGGQGKVKAITGGLVVVHIDSLQLQVTVSMVTASGVDAVLIADDFPKLRHRKTCIRPRPTAERPATHNERLGSDSPASPQLEGSHTRTAAGLALCRVTELKLGVSWANSCSRREAGFSVGRRGTSNWKAGARGARRRGAAGGVGDRRR